MKKIKSLLAVLAAAVCALCVFAFSSSAADEGKWISAWSTAPTEIGLDGYGNIGVMAQNIAVRTVVTPTASGSKIRIKFSNRYGKEPLEIAYATVAVSTGKSGIDKSTLKAVTFADSVGDNTYGVTIPAYSEVWSDEINFETTAGEDIAVSMYISKFSQLRTMGLYGGYTYLNMDITGESDGIELVRSENFNPLSGIEFEQQWVYTMLDKLIGSILQTGTLEIPISEGRISIVPVMTDVDVLNPDDDAYSVVVIGDSTVANNFPTFLFEELEARSIKNIGISAKGLMGNQLMGEGLGYSSLIYGESVLERKEEDIIGFDGLNKSNVKYVVLKAGANDIIYPVCKNVIDAKQPTAQQLIEGYRKIFDFCHKNDIKIIVIGITPWNGYRGTAFSGGLQYDRSSADVKKDWAIACEVNEWLAHTNEHDGFVDLSEVSVNPNDPTSLHPDFAVDGMYPAVNLQRIWAQVFPFSLIGADESPKPVSIGISASELTLYRGQSGRLTATVAPKDTVSQSVIWSSSNKAIVDVDSKGNLVAKAKGTATVTVKTTEKDSNGRYLTAACKVTVKVKPTSITVSGSGDAIYTTTTKKLTATVYPTDSDFKTVIWSSSDEKVASVDQNGLVTGKGKGTAVITVKSTVDANVKATFTVKVNKKVQVQAIYLNYSEKSVNLGKSFTLVPSVSPSNATYQSVTWMSSDSKIAKVDKNGKVTALKVGDAVITCKSVDNPGVTAFCLVSVKIKTEDVELPTSKLTLYVSQSKTLKAEISPSNATNKKVTWSSSNKSVATVSSSGKITARKPGTAIITVKTKSGGYTDTCKVTVKKYVALKSFRLNKSSVSINDGKTYTLKAVFSPSNASNKDLVWKSSNTDIATVSSKGVVKGVKPGTCTISCKSKQTGKTVKCTVTVKKVGVEKLIFSQKVYTVKHNGTLQLTCVVSPTNATNKKIKWESSHPDFVKVNSKGKVTGVKLGKNATITATSVDGKIIATCRVKVAKIDLKGLKLNKSTASTFTGSTVTLSPVFSPSNASNQKVTWSSSDEKIATVSSTGVVTALKKGTAVISCISDEGKYTAKCTVVIQEGVRVTGVTLDKKSEEANVGTAFNLIATVAPANASNKKLIWTSTNTAVATVSANGRVLTLKEGVTYIQVRTEDGKKVASCRITVVP